MHHYCAGKLRYCVSVIECGHLVNGDAYCSSHKYHG